MSVVIPNSELSQVLQSARYSLFRLELQPVYGEPEEATYVERFTAGSPVDPTTTPSTTWYEQVRCWRRAGIRIERVRVHEDTPTDYQKWERWVGAWNIDAGEVMRYLTRSQAHTIGLLPAAGTTDWWLLDSNRVVTLHFNHEHQRIRTELTTDPTFVVQANEWRDLAVHHSHPESLTGIASRGIK
ncbi:DUF6879 family protein [Stackebrandtia soli]|uniref:DUF6879 family protein n=1 Tax=Stackebrandtia soli TaxID=1892856 RepID=UPI0039E8F770